ncbi:MAG: type II toxin-antitoxin system VapC family toxin [Pyrinomonadaceae bacterium]
MKVLIDTHIFLWFMEGVRLSQKARNFLQDTFNNEIFVSHVTAWEISIKYGIGKLKIPDVPEIWVPDRIRRAGFKQLPIEIQHALRVHNLPLIHKDPFDRMLISQANVENLTIVTEDPNFAKYQVKTSDLKSL